MSIVVKRLMAVPLSFAIGAGIYWFVLWYFGPLTPRAESRIGDIALLVQFFCALAGWIHALRQNNSLRAEVKTLKEELQAARRSTQ